MHRSRILPQIVEVQFDVADSTHVDAAMSLVLHGRQHETLRFRVEYPFLSVKERVLTKLSVKAAELLTGTTYLPRKPFGREAHGLNQMFERVLHPVRKLHTGKEFVRA